MINIYFNYIPTSSQVQCRDKIFIFLSYVVFYIDLVSVCRESGLNTLPSDFLYSCIMITFTGNFVIHDACLSHGDAASGQSKIRDGWIGW